jgi:hypothetical protein
VARQLITVIEDKNQFSHDEQEEMKNDIKLIKKASTRKSSVAAKRRVTVDRLTNPDPPESSKVRPPILLSAKRF